MLFLDHRGGFLSLAQLPRCLVFVQLGWGERHRESEYPAISNSCTASVQMQKTRLAAGIAYSGGCQQGSYSKSPRRRHGKSV